MKTIPKSEWSEHYAGLTEEALKKVPKLNGFDPSYTKNMIESFWYHKIHLGGGFYTPGTYNMDEYIQYFPIPKDLNGKTVVELGAAEGFFSFLIEKRGAKVIAIDLFDNAIEHMEFLKKIFEYETEIKKLDILESDLTHLGKFDYVLAANIMQHIKPGHNINDHSKEDFIRILKLLVKDHGTIIVASDSQSDIDLLRKHFKHINKVSEFKMTGFKVRTQNKHESNTIVVEINV